MVVHMLYSDAKSDDASWYQLYKRNAIFNVKHKEVAMRKGVDIKCVDLIKIKKENVYFVLPSTQKVQMSEKLLES